MRIISNLRKWNRKQTVVKFFKAVISLSEEVRSVPEMGIQGPVSMTLHDSLQEHMYCSYGLTGCVKRWKAYMERLQHF